MELQTIGIDLGKTVFHLVGLNMRGEVEVRKKFSRKQLLHFTANLLFATAAEFLDSPNKCLEKGSHPKLRMAPKGIQQMGHSKLFPIRARRFGDPICVENQGVTWSKPHFRNLAVPGLKQSHHCAGR